MDVPCNTIPPPFEGFVGLLMARLEACVWSRKGWVVWTPPPPRHQIWQEIFLSYSICNHNENENDTGHYKVKIRKRQNTGWVCMGFVWVLEG